MATPVLGSAVMSTVEAQRGGMAAGALNTTRQLGFAFGIAALGSVFAARASHVLADRGASGPDGLAKALAGGQARRIVSATPSRLRDAVDSGLHAAAVSGVQWTLLISGVLGVLTGVTVIVLLRRPREVGDPAANPDDRRVAEPA